MPAFIFWVTVFRLLMRGPCATGVSQLSHSTRGLHSNEPPWLLSNSHAACLPLDHWGLLAPKPPPRLAKWGSCIVAAWSGDWPSRVVYCCGGGSCSVRGDNGAAVWWLAPHRPAGPGGRRGTKRGVRRERETDRRSEGGKRANVEYRNKRGREDDRG